MNHSQSQVGSFRDTLQSVREQIEVEAFGADKRQQAEEVAMIVAEVYRLYPGTEIQIGGQKIPVDLVQDIYARLEHEHVESVLESFGEATYAIKHAKSYLRTALYNAVFEAESRTVNQVMTAMPWLAR